MNEPRRIRQDVSLFGVAEAAIKTADQLRFLPFSDEHGNGLELRYRNRTGQGFWMLLCTDNARPA